MSLDRGKRVYVNRDLKLAQIEWVGFDMDYTLAIYRQEEMDRLSVQAIVRKLIARDYPAWLTDIEYPLAFPIRGLLIDKKLGNILKMNRFKIVRRGYHGLVELTAEQLREQYYTRKLRPHSERYHWIDTLYGLSEACAYASIIDGYQKRGEKVHCGQLFAAIRECIDEAHRDGSILDAVAADLDRYVERDPALAVTLHKLRSAGKRLFVLTNSHKEYTESMLSHLLDGALSDYPSYKQYFDAIIVAARKPDFFQAGEPLLAYRNGDLVPAQGPFERGVIYHGGNVGQLQAALGVSDNRVLYVGDHIYGDILRSKKDSAWRTAMIIQELFGEVAAHACCRDMLEQWDELYERRTELEDHLRHGQARFKSLEKRGDADDKLRLGQAKKVIQSVRKQLRAIDREAGGLRSRIDREFHPYWGSLLKQEAELSLFGYQVDRYACIYTARVSHLLAYSPHQYFRSPRGLMHHEI
jgi:HAD superfamily 5'-nucleotidase-like hydrolase